MRTARYSASARGSSTWGSSVSESARAKRALEHEDAGLLSAIPGLARIAAGAAVRTAGWSLDAYVRASSRVLRAARAGEPAAEVLREAGDEFRGFARELLGIANGTREGASAAGGAGAGEVASGRDDGVGDPLRERAAELLRRSADVHYDEPAHPAYERILDELAPDEGRILRLLMREGPQPAVDVRSSKTLNVNSQLVAPGLSMIGAHAGCRYIDRVPAYLNNLFRLGLIWFSREPLEDPVRYQVLEAQPDVLEALHAGGRARTVRRSIMLTPFGEDFCRVCMPGERVSTPLDSRAMNGSDDRLFGPEHVRVYRETNGERGYHWRGTTILLLTTKGRRSGEPRTMPLIHRTDGDRWVVVASKGGSPEHPLWYQNLQADPDAEIQVKGEVIPVHAEDAKGEERERLWSLMTEVWPPYDEYQARTDREIPVVILSRR
jgi:deazaflavin-dependent oxidoreductase (nitroreductase family)